MPRRTREQKYPDTNTFHFYNANPKNKYTTDCVIRAIATATTLSYETVLMDLAELQCKTGYDMSEPKCYGKYLESLGWKKQKQPKKWDNTKFTGKEFCKEIGRYDSCVDSGNNINRQIVHIGGHHIAAVISGVIYDTWDCTDGCIGNYWIL